MGYNTAMLSGNAISGNSARLDGGGLFLRSSAAMLTGNTVCSNTVDWDGGGLYLHHSIHPGLTDNAISDNSAAKRGGGLFLHQSNARLSTNRVSANSADRGGGLYLDQSYGSLSDNTISGNFAGRGGGLCISLVYPQTKWYATLTGNVISDNTAERGGSFAFRRQSGRMQVLHDRTEETGGRCQIKYVSPARGVILFYLLQTFCQTGVKGGIVIYSGFIVAAFNKGVYFFGRGAGD